MPRAAIVRDKAAPMSVEEIELRPVGAHEVRVTVKACGVCHSDLSVLNEFFACPVPVVLGHEAAGVVAEVGPDVTNVEVGDHIVAAWSPACGECRFCRKGRVHLCNLSDDPTSRAMDRVTVGGEPVAQFLGVGGFATEVILADNAVVKIDKDMPLDRAALLGCAVVTGYGAAHYAAKVQPGDEVAVFGCGGVGLNIIQGARLAGATVIIAVDVDEAKLEVAKTFGATHVLDGREEGLHKSLRKLTTDRAGLDFAFEAVGNVGLARTGYQAICKGGEVILVGIAHFKDKLELSQIVAVTQEKGVRGTTNGSADTWKAVPELISLYRSGDLDLDHLVSKTYTLDQVNDAIEDMRAGRNARGVILMNQ
ncbi:MAG: Zn-dependent alcohol dehydrogenase [Hyphomicrobiaceae bacterium]|jgi:Zn-dependent alcohol dehydrogenase